MKPSHPLPPFHHLERNIAEAPTLSIFLTATHNTHPFAQAHPPPQEAVKLDVVDAHAHAEAHIVLHTIPDGGDNERRRLRSNRVISGLSEAVNDHPDHAAALV